MKKLKKIIKSVLGIYRTHVLKELFHKFFNTKLYKENRKFEERSFEFYSRFIGENDIVFDVGANFGNRVKTFISLNSKVIAIEPQEACCKYLRRKYGETIILINKAVGEKKEVKKMYISNNSAVSSFSEDWISSVKNDRYKEENWNKYEMIEQVTLDEIIDVYGYPVFIKIDVEGYELEVLKGLSKEVKYLSFEYTVPEQTETAVKCINHLKNISKEIECNYSVGESLKFQLENWISDTEMINLIQDKEFPTYVGDIYIRKKI